MINLNGGVDENDQRVFMTGKVLNGGSGGSDSGGEHGLLTDHAEGTCATGHRYLAPTIEVVMCEVGGGFVGSGWEDGPWPDGQGDWPNDTDPMVEDEWEDF